MSSRTTPDPKKGLSFDEYYGFKKSKEIRDKMSVARVGRSIPSSKKGLTYEEFYGSERAEEIRGKIGKSGITRFSNMSGREKEILSEIRKEAWTIEKKEAHSKRNSGEKNPFHGKCHTEETKQKIRQSQMESGSTQRSSERMKVDNPMFNIKILEKAMKTHAKNGSIFTIPNQAEIRLNEFLEENFPEEWDWELWIGGKNPDFVHTSKKKLIELFGDYWHSKGDEQTRINHFSRHGYDCLVIWEHELESEKLANKISEWVK